MQQLTNNATITKVSGIIFLAFKYRRPSGRSSVKLPLFILPCRFSAQEQPTSLKRAHENRLNDFENSFTHLLPTCLHAAK